MLMSKVAGYAIFYAMSIIIYIVIVAAKVFNHLEPVLTVAMGLSYYAISYYFWLRDVPRGGMLMFFELSCIAILIDVSLWAAAGVNLKYLAVLQVVLLFVLCNGSQYEFVGRVKRGRRPSESE